MQAIYYPISQVTVDISVDKELRIISNHDEYCLWFDVSKNLTEDIERIPMPFPKTGIEACVSRMRLGQINDSERNDKYIKSFRKMINNYKAKHCKLPENILCISELTLLPFIAAVILSEFGNPENLCSTKIHVYEENKQMTNFLRLFEKMNKNYLSNIEIQYHSLKIPELNPNDISHQVINVSNQNKFT